MCGLQHVLYLKRVIIKNILSFKHADLPFDTYTVIVGPNNSGKTNLLRILDMISKNENLEYLQLDKEQKLDPDAPSEITLMLDLDESEVKMVFQCILGLDYQVNAVSETLRRLAITIFWDNDQLDILWPKFTLYRFGSGFTILTNTTEGNIAFDASRIFAGEMDYQAAINSWKTAPPQKIIASVVKQLGSVRHDEIKHKKEFREVILEGRRFIHAAGGHAVMLPMSIRYNQNAATPIIKLIRGRDYPDEFATIPTGMVLNRIFEVGFTLIREIYPTYKDLSNNLAMLRNRDQAKYDKLRAAFKSISGNIEVLVEQDGNNAEHILFKEGDRRYGINNSASGYYALTSILYKLLEGQSGLVAIDEPEIHLHPGMSSRLHSMLEDMACQNCIQIVVVTHSTKFVTHRQIANSDGPGLIMLTRHGAASKVHADTEKSAPTIKPHLFNPEIFFGNGSLLVEGHSDYFVQMAISDLYGGWFEKNNIVLIHCWGKDNIPAHAKLHQRFGIPYHCMVDGDYQYDLEHVTKLAKDLEAELVNMGVPDVKPKEDHNVYGKMMNFLRNAKGNEEWKKSGIWKAFEKTMQKADMSVPS